MATCKEVQTSLQDDGQHKRISVAQCMEGIWKFGMRCVRRLASTPVSCDPRLVAYTLNYSKENNPIRCLTTVTLVQGTPKSFTLCCAP